MKLLEFKGEKEVYELVNMSSYCRGESLDSPLGGPKGSPLRFTGFLD
jgi:hypothetical protein